MNSFEIFGDVTTWTLREFNKFIAETPSNTTIQLDILSYGGDLFSGIAIAEKISEARNRGIKTHAVIYGVAASASAIVALSAERVVMSELGSMMLHGAYRQNSGGGIIKEGDDIARANAVCLAIINRRCPSYSMEKLVDKDQWYSADEAKKMGFVDEIRPIEEFAKDDGFKNFFSGILNMATRANFPNGGHEMKSGGVKNETEKVVEETKVEKEVVEENGENKENAAEKNDKKTPSIETLIVDGVNAILTRLDVLENAILSSRDDKKEVVKKEEDDSEEDIMAAKINAMYNKIGQISAPCAKKTRDEKSEIKAAAERVKQVFPNISKYYE